MPPLALADIIGHPVVAEQVLGHFDHDVAGLGVASSSASATNCRQAGRG